MSNESSAVAARIEAREILIDRFGRPEQVVEAIIDFTQPKDVRAAIRETLKEVACMVREHGARDALEWLLTVAVPLKGGVE